MTYKLMNVRNIDQVYTDKLIISNVDLTKVELATEEDRKYRLDEWGRFFKATTWKEMKMLAKKNTSIGKAVSGVWQLTEEEMIREQCRAREEWIINDRWKTNKIEEQSQQIAKLLDANARQTDQITQQSDQIAKQSDQIAKQSDQITKQSDQIAHLEREIQELRRKLEKPDNN